MQFRDYPQAVGFWVTHVPVSSGYVRYGLFPVTVRAVTHLRSSPRLPRCGCYRSCACLHYPLVGVVTLVILFWGPVHLRYHLPLHCSTYTLLLHGEQYDMVTTILHSLHVLLLLLL